MRTCLIRRQASTLDSGTQIDYAEGPCICIFSLINKARVPRANLVRRFIDIPCTDGHRRTGLHVQCMSLASQQTVVRREGNVIIDSNALAINTYMHAPCPPKWR